MELAKQNDYAVKRAASIGVLFVGAVAARLFWINQVRALWGDEPFAAWMSGGLSSVVASGELAAGAPSAPLFPVFVDGIARFFESVGVAGPLSLELGAILMYVLFGGLLVAPVYGIARRMGGEAIAAGAGLATVFYPAMLGSFPQAGALVEPVYLLLVVAAWYFLLMAVDESILWPAAFGGLFVGLAYLTRPEALGYLGFALGLLLVATWLSRRHHFALRRAAVNLVVAAAMFSFVAGPHLARLFQLEL